MKWFAETTQWSDRTPNGVYLLDDSKSKAFAFRPFGGKGSITVFKNPLRIDTRGRKFALNAEQYAVALSEPEPQGRTWSVTGSRGDTYTVTELNGHVTCSCSGFKFRGQCRHVKELSLAQ